MSATVNAKPPSFEAQRARALRLASELVADEFKLVLDREEVAGPLIGLGQAQGIARVR